MRRLIVTTFLAAAATAALGGSAHAADPIPPSPSIYECFGVVAAGTEAGVCAGTFCWDLCGPRLVVDTYCRQSQGPYLATCVFIDELR